METAEQPKPDLLALKRKIEALSPAARLMMASQLVARDGGKAGEDAVEMGMTIAENTVLEYRAAKLLNKLNR